MVNSHNFFLTDGAGLLAVQTQQDMYQVSISDACFSSRIIYAEQTLFFGSRSGLNDHGAPAK